MVLIIFHITVKIIEDTVKAVLNDNKGDQIWLKNSPEKN